MKRQLETKEMKAWIGSVGGTKQAARLISETLECSISKAEKLAGCRYPSLPNPTEQIALALLLERPRDILFPLFKGRNGRRAS